MNMTLILFLSQANLRRQRFHEINDRAADRAPTGL